MYNANILSKGVHTNDRGYMYIVCFHYLSQEGGVVFETIILVYMQDTEKKITTHPRVWDLI